MKFTYLALPVLIAVAAPAFAEDLTMDVTDLAALDENGDGVVSKEEFDAFTGFAFETIDKDGSGDLSPDEVDDFVIGDAFDMLDDDGNGVVSISEFSAEMEGDFATADQDGDGAIN